MNLSRYMWWGVHTLWVGLLVVLVAGAFQTRSGGLRAPVEMMKKVSLAEESSWMEIFLNNRKIGYLNTEVIPQEDGGYLIREFSRMNAAMMGFGQDMKLRMDVVTDSTLAMLSFDGYLEVDPYITEFRGEVKEKVLSVKITAGGQTSEKFIPAPEPLYTSQSIKPLLRAGRLNEGDSLVLSGFDPISLEMKGLVVVGKGTIEMPAPTNPDGVARMHKLTTSMAGFESTLLLDEDYDIISERGPMGMTMRRETKEKALKFGSGGSVDFLSIYAIYPFGDKIDKPRSVVRGRYRLIEVDDEGILNEIITCSDHQTMVDRDKKIIEVSNEAVKSELKDRIVYSALQRGNQRRKDAAEAEVSELSDESDEIVRSDSVKVDLDEYVRDAPFIESRNQQIIEAAKSVVWDQASRSDSLNALADWIFCQVKKYPSAGIPSALAVLNNMRGDCNEHSVLFTAMARSLGIPTRIQLGVVYQEGQFFYHAWPASIVDGKWVEFDPTLGLKRADAARIALTSGDMTDAIKLVGLIGELKIEIIETE